MLAAKQRRQQEREMERDIRRHFHTHTHTYTNSRHTQHSFPFTFACPHSLSLAHTHTQTEAHPDTDTDTDTHTQAHTSEFSPFLPPSLSPGTWHSAPATCCYYMTGATKTRHQSSSYCTGTDTLTSFQNISLLLSFHTSVLLVRVPLLDPVASISPIDHSVSSSRRSDTPGKANKRPGRSVAETASTHLCVSTYHASWACCFPSRVVPRYRSNTSPALFQPSH
jgi:hypothetical protein